MDNNRKGFISVIALLIMMLIFMNVVFLLYMGNLQICLSKLSTNNIKANYLSEDIMNHFIYDMDKFNGYLREIIFRDSRGYTVSYSKIKSDIEKEIVKKEGFSFCKVEIDKESKEMKLELSSDCNDVVSSVGIDICFVNDIFERETSIIDINNLEDDKKEQFQEYLNILEAKIFGYDGKLDMEKSGTNVFKRNIYNKAEILSASGDKKSILFDLENDVPKSIPEVSNKRLLLNIRNIDINNRVNSKLILGKKDDPKELTLKGVYYVEGDIIINQDLDFEGIIIINNGNLFIEDDIKVCIKGMILYRGEEEIDLDPIELVYDKKVLLKYASYLPGYINPKIQLIKSIDL